MVCSNEKNIAIFRSKGNDIMKINDALCVIVISVVSFSAGWIWTESFRHYYTNHIAAISIETGEQIEVIFKGE